MKTIAIIPARSGSKGLKDKNIADICGKPLIYYTISAALESKCFDTVMVSTDSEEYAKVSIRCGAEVPFLRSEEMSRDTSGTWDAVREVLTQYKNLGQKYDYVAVLQPTSPLRTKEDIQKAYDMLQNENTNSVVSVTETEHPIQWCFKLDNTRSLSEFAKSPYSMLRRQELEKYYHENGAIYFVDAQKIMSESYNFYFDNCVAYIMNRTHSIDIDEKMDLEIARIMIKNKTL